MSLTKKQNKIIIAVLILFSFLFFISSAYITNSNDGSHFALTSALVQDKSVNISNFMDYTDYKDYAIKDGNYYSDRIPGTAFLAVPFFIVGHFFSVSEVTVLFLPQIAGVLLIYLMFILSFYYTKKFNISLLSTILFGLTTSVWFESTHLFSHILSAVTAFGAVVLAIVIQKNSEKYLLKCLGIAGLLGFSSIIEIQNIMIVPAVLIYLFVSKKINYKKIKFPAFLFIFIYAILIGYNYIAFDEFTIKSNKYNPEFPEEQTYFSSLSGDALSGLDHLFFNLTEPNIIYDFAFAIRHNSPGFFILSPLLFLALFGFIKFFKKYTKEALLFAYIIIFISLIGAFHNTVITRHIFTMLPFLWFPIIFSFEKIFNLKKISKYIWLFLIIVTSIYSAIRVFYIMNNYWSRSLDDFFPFLREWYVYLLFYIFIFVVYLGSNFIWKKFKKK
jgi:hypothetical protein